MPEVDFYPAMIEDLSLLVEMERACFAERDAFSRSYIKRLLLNPYGSCHCELILKDGPAGWACWMTRKRSQVIRLYSLAILPAFQGRGLAQAYLQKKFAEFAGQYRFCHLEVKSSNERALALYRKLGFVVIKYLPHYYGDEDGFRMRLVF